MINETLEQQAERMERELTQELFAPQNQAVMYTNAERRAQIILRELQLVRANALEEAEQTARRMMPRHGDFKPDYQQGVVQQTVNIEAAIRALQSSTNKEQT